MPDTTLILLSAGNSTRFDSIVKKQWLCIHDKPLWLHVAENFEHANNFAKIIVVSSKEEIIHMKNFANYTYVVGGKDRQSSLSNALDSAETDYVLVSDIARCCVPPEMIQRILNAKGHATCVVPVLDVVDTLYMDNLPIDREKTKIIQTPQLSETALLRKALQGDVVYSDDSSAIAHLGEKVFFVEGSTKAHKLTRLEDLKKLSCLRVPLHKTLIGYGMDIHPFEENKQMFLCGVPIDVNYGFKAHSDGDVAIHALIDAILGAVGMGDIGELYPDTDTTYENIDSKILLINTVERIESYGYKIENIDMTIVAEAPKLLPYKNQMRELLASLLHIRKNFVNIKATTAEKLGFVGRKEGVMVQAVANLTYINWKTL